MDKQPVDLTRSEKQLIDRIRQLYNDSLKQNGNCVIMVIEIGERLCWWGAQHQERPSR